MRRIRKHLSFANVASALALFIAISGGTAVALNGQNTVQSDDIGPGAQVKAADVANNAVNGADLAPNSLTGADIQDRSGVDTCVDTIRIGDLCYRAENFDRPWRDALAHCANLGLRVPSLGEALELAKTNDLTNVDEDEFFWTDHYFFEGPGTGQKAFIVRDVGDSYFATSIANARETVCVGTPVN